MIMAVEEKRLYPRLSLKSADGFFGNFKLPDEEIMAAQIISLSAGGINVIAALKMAERIKEGDILFLINIAGATNLKFISDVKADVRWIREMNKPDLFNVGCRFKDLDEEARQQLIRFVDSERIARGQYN